MTNYCETAATLLEAHNRLRGSGFTIISVICARAELDARVWLHQCAASRGRGVVLVPEIDPKAALAAYLTRVPTFKRKRSETSWDNSLPFLLLPAHNLAMALSTGLFLTKGDERLPVAITCGIAAIVEHLLDLTVPLASVGAALQGLVPIGEAENKVLEKVAKGRKLTPFLRGPCEGLVFYMLDARPDTRSRFLANQRIGCRNGRTYEVDIVCNEARLIVEIDGPEHNQSARQAMDERKLRDLEEEGYRVRRFTNKQVIDDPVGVWQLIAEQLR